MLKKIYYFEHWFIYINYVMSANLILVLNKKIKCDFALIQIHLIYRWTNKAVRNLIILLFSYFLLTIISVSKVRLCETSLNTSNALQFYIKNTKYARINNILYWYLKIIYNYSYKISRPYLSYNKKHIKCIIYNWYRFDVQLLGGLLNLISKRIDSITFIFEFHFTTKYFFQIYIWTKYFKLL